MIHRITAILGIIAVAPLILFVSANVIVYEVGFFRGYDIASLHPALLLGGTFAALFLNAWSILEFRVTGDNGKLWIMCGFTNRPWNLAVVIVAAGFLFLLVGYVAFDNFDRLIAV